MDTIRAVRGTRDILGDESWKWERVLSVCGDVANDFGFAQVILPIFEHTELFSRGVGDTTDIVEKEMYTFLDRGGRSVTLRPELTASMVRSYLEHDMGWLPQPVKLWSWGPMFRYERPQKGRYRQFYQIDFEILGADSPFADIETIDASMEIYRRLGLSNLQVLINSVGCPECRPVYRKILQKFLVPKMDDFCDSCRGRFGRNPLRILDCKNPVCKELTAQAPSMIDSLCGECGQHFDSVMKGLAAIGADVEIDNRLVRGLDYYTRTAYEILAGELGAQNAVCGGGRYDNLAEAIGGPHVPGVGFASGIERIVLTIDGQSSDTGSAHHLDIYVVSASGKADMDVMSLVHNLRSAGLSAGMDIMQRNLKAQMKSASATGAKYACIIGDDELASGTVAVKDMNTGEQHSVANADVLGTIMAKVGKARE